MLDRAGALILAAALLVSGCIGSTGDELGTSSADELPGAQTEALSLTFDPDPGPQDRRQLQQPLTVPDGTQGLFITYELKLEDAGDAEAWLETPKGDRIELAFTTTTSTPTPTTIEDHRLLDPQPGEWTLHLDTSAPGELAADVTIQPKAPTLTVTEPTGPTRPVIAVVDTGVNPYHQVFQSGLATEDLPSRILEDGSRAPISLPINAQATYEGSLARDAALWANVPDERLVHFEGTSLLGYQLGDTELPQAPVLDRAGHGTSVAHAALGQAPNATVVLVTGSNYDDGVEWAAQQPWIDLVSLSWGPAVNAAGVLEPYAFGFRTPEVTNAADKAGKLVLTASGNDPTATVTDTTTGPPWVHAVSGAQPDTRGRAGMSGNLVDTVAAWTQTLADHESRTNTSQGSGTSFATPLTAGVAARILHQVRDETGHDGGIEDGALVNTPDTTVTSGDLRHALNRSAVYWNTTDYGGPTDPGPSIPVAPTPWVSMGWGYIDGSIVEPAVAGLTGQADLPDKSDEAQAWMENHQQSRETYWRGG